MMIVHGYRLRFVNEMSLNLAEIFGCRRRIIDILLKTNWISGRNETTKFGSRTTNRTSFVLCCFYCLKLKRSLWTRTACMVIGECSETIKTPRAARPTSDFVFWFVPIFRIVLTIERYLTIIQYMDYKESLHEKRTKQRKCQNTSETNEYVYICDLAIVSGYWAI